MKKKVTEAKAPAPRKPRASSGDVAASGLNQADADFDRRQAQFRADQELRKYAYGRHGLFLWRAFLAYRQAGQPVGELVLSELEKIATRLQGANTGPEILRSLKLAHGNNKAKTPRDALAIEHQILALTEVVDAIGRRTRLKANQTEGKKLGNSASDTGETNEEIFERVAARYDQVGVKTLKAKYYRWLAVQKRAKA